MRSRIRRLCLDAFSVTLPYVTASPLRKRSTRRVFHAARNDFPTWLAAGRRFAKSGKLTCRAALNWQTRLPDTHAGRIPCGIARQGSMKVPAIARRSRSTPRFASCLQSLMKKKINNIKLKHSFVQASKEVFPNGSTEEKRYQKARRQETLERLEARAAGMVKCPKCGEYNRAHRVCGACGYKGRGNRKEGSVSLLEKAERIAFPFRYKKRAHRALVSFMRLSTAYDKNTFMTSMTSSRVSNPEMEMMRFNRYLIVLSETCRISAMSKIPIALDDQLEQIKCRSRRRQTEFFPPERCGTRSVVVKAASACARQMYRAQRLFHDRQGKRWCRR